MTPLEGMDACTVIPSATGAAGEMFLQPESVPNPRQRITSNMRLQPMAADFRLEKKGSRMAHTPSKHRKIRAMEWPWMGGKNPLAAMVFGSTISVMICGVCVCATNVSVGELNWQLAPRIRPAQERLTMPAKPFFGVRVRVVSPVLPVEMESSVGLAVMVNVSSATVTVAEVDVDGAKLASP